VQGKCSAVESNQVTALNLSEGTRMAVYADDILLFKVLIGYNRQPHFLPCHVCEKILEIAV